MEMVLDKLFNAGHGQMTLTQHGDVKKLPASF